MGRPSKFKEEFCQQAEKLCYLGATDKELADFFEVDERTINRWKEENDEFCQSLKRGKVNADSMVAERLFKRATGYEHPEDKIFQFEGSPVIVPTIKHYAPDTLACIFWLKNRRPDLWRDKVQQELSGPDGAPLSPPDVSDEKLERLAAMIAKADANRGQ